MSKAIYIASADHYSGKSVVSIGLMHLLSGRMKRVAFFKPVVNHPEEVERDVHIATMLKQFDLRQSYRDTYALTFDELLRLSSAGNQAQIIDTIITRYKALEESHDFVLVEGTGFEGEGFSFEFEANVEIAHNLGIPMMLVCRADHHEPHEIANNLITHYRTLEDHDVAVLGVVANKANPEHTSQLSQDLRQRLPAEVMLSVIPYEFELGSPTMQEIAQALDAQWMFGEAQASNRVDEFIVGAMQLRNCLTRLKENALVVTPGDRADVLVAMLQANLSKNYPNVAGLVLTGGLLPEEPILQLVAGSQQIVPIVQVETDTFETVKRIGDIHSRIYPENHAKIELAIDLFERYFQAEEVLQRIQAAQPEGMTPRMFQYELVKRARANRKHVVLPEGDDDRILLAAAKLIKQDVVDLTILGDETQIMSSFHRLNLKVDFSRLNVVNPATAERFDAYVDALFELRKHKGLSREGAADLMRDVSYFGTMMVHLGEADGMVSGAKHTTQHTIRPALQFVKTKPGIETVSSVFFMCLPDRVVVFGDCAVNPNPTAEQLADIAIASAQSSERFGMEPRVAMLSYSSGNSGQGEDVEKVRQATQLVRERMPNLFVEGPIQYDAAVDPTVAAQKMPGSPVAGQASVLIFPDLNTGNNTYKAVQRETGAVAIGPMLQGLNKPVNDLSRGCTVDDVFNTVVITAIQAQMN